MKAWNPFNKDEDKVAPEDAVVPIKSLKEEEEQERKRKEEAEEARKNHWSEGNLFNVGVGVIVLLGAVLVGLECDYGKEDVSAQTLILFQVLNVFMMLVYVGEAMIRIGVQGIWYFKNPWYLFDFLVTIMNVLEVAILLFFSIDAPLSMFTVLRLCRIFRVARIVRIFYIFKELWLVLCGLVRVVGVLTWTLIVLTILFFTVAPLCRLLIPPEQDVNQQFISLEITFLTLFRILTLDDWAETIVRPLIEAGNIFMVFIFIFFIFIASFGFMNIVLGIIVHSQEKIAEDQRIEVEKRIQKQKKKAIRSLADYFAQYDTDESGMIEFNEFKKAMKDPRVQSFLAKLDLPITDIRQLFVMLSENATVDEGISHDRFVSGCSDLISTDPTNQKMLLMSYNLKSVQHLFAKESNRMADLRYRIDSFQYVFRNVDAHVYNFAMDTNEPLVQLRKSSGVGGESSVKANMRRNMRRYEEIAEKYHGNRAILEKKKKKEKLKRQQKKERELAEKLQEKINNSVHS